MARGGEGVGRRRLRDADDSWDGVNCEDDVGDLYADEDDEQRRRLPLVEWGACRRRRARTRLRALGGGVGFMVAIGK